MDKAGWLLALCLLIAPQVRAGIPETPQPRQMSVADGLPSNRINAVTEDHQGYLWIATSDGLARYDGIGYRIWRNEQGLRDNVVWSLHVDAQDQLWIGTGDAGLAVLDRSRRRFRYYDRSNTPAMGSNSVWSVVSTPDGATWFGTASGGLHRMAVDGVVTRFMPRDGDARSLPDAAVTHLAVGRDGTLWVVTRNGAARWTGRDFERMPASGFNSASIDGLAVEDDGRAWFGTPRGVSLRRIDGRMEVAPFAAFGEETVFKMLARDATGAAWLDIAEGLGRIRDGRIVNVPLYSGAAKGIVKPTWSGGYEDRSGGLWFASNAHGLWYLPPNWRLFSVLSRLAGDPASLANAHVRGIAPSSNGSVWLVGSGGALDRLDPDSGEVTHVLANVGDGFVPVSVFEDSRGKVWVGTLDGLARFDPLTGAVARWHSSDVVDPALPTDTTAFVETAAGALWIASDGALQVRDLDGTVRATVAPGTQQGIASGAYIAQLGLAPDGGVWLAGSQGLSMWNAGTRAFEPVPGAPLDHVFGYTIDSGGKVWLARMGKLDRYAWDGSALVHELAIDRSDGLPQIGASGLVADAAGIVWLSSVRGMVRVDPTLRSVRVYGVHDGLPSQEFGEAPVARPGDGRILVGSPDGLVLFDPRVVRPESRVPGLVIEAASARGQGGRVDFAADRRFVVAHGDRDLRIVARLLSFNDASTNRYRFHLEGYDQGWVESGATGERVFSQLRPGEYMLHVKARTADNVWSAERVMHFSVASPWWLTPWAAVAWATLAMGLLAWLVLGVRHRVRRVNAWQLARQQHELARQASQAKTHFLATLGHEVRTPMTGVLGMSELLLDTPLDPRQRSYTESIRRAGEHLMRLVNDALDLARIEAGKLELDVDVFDLQALVREITALMAPMARQHALEFRVGGAPGTPGWLVGDATRLRQILLNLLGNAIKFTEQGHVGLHVAPLAPYGVRFVVSDSGPGLSDEHRKRLFRRFEQADGGRTASRYGGSGLGLAICQELAAAMHGSIAVDSAPGEGTRFSVDLPLASAPGPATASVQPRVPTAPLQLLLVEDDPTVAEVIAGLLRAQGHAVVHASHGLAALGALATHVFDLALLDLDLPVIDGLELAAQMRVQGFDRPLVAVTARADAGAEPLARAAGFDAFLRKPVTGDMLAETIEAALAAHRDGKHAAC